MAKQSAAQAQANPMRNIRRMDDDSRSTHAWLVQVQRHHQIAIKMFSDSVWGGKRKALAAARAWRDEHKQAPAEQAHALWRRNRLRSNNRSGLVGVARHERTVGANGRKNPGAAFWMASWTDEHGGTRQRKFSVKRWANGVRSRRPSRPVRRASATRWRLRLGCCLAKGPQGAVRNHAPQLRRQLGAGGFGTDLMLKDLGLARENPTAVQAATPLGGLARSLYAAHSLAGNGGLDFSSVLGMVRPGAN